MCYGNCKAVRENDDCLKILHINIICKIIKLRIKIIFKTFGGAGVLYIDINNTATANLNNPDIVWQNNPNSWSTH